VEYAQAVRERIRSNLVLPDGIPQSAGAVAELILAPSGEVEELKIVQSSGYRLYDDAIQKAVFHAEPLPVMEGWISSGQSQQLMLFFRVSE